MADDNIQDDSTTQDTTAETADTPGDTPAPAKKTAARKTAAKKTAAKKTTAKKTTAKKTAAKKAAAPETEAPAPDGEASAEPEVAEVAEAPEAAPAKKTAARKAAAKKTTAKKATAKKTTTRKKADAEAAPEVEPAETPSETPSEASAEKPADVADESGPAGTMPLFQAPEAPAKKAPAKRTRSRKKPEPAPVEETTAEDETPVEEAPVVEEAPAAEVPADETPVEESPVEETPADESTEESTDEESKDGSDDESPSDSADDNDDSDDDNDESGAPRRRRRRGGRRRRRGGSGGADDAEGDDKPEAEQGDTETADTADDSKSDSDGEASEGGSASTRRRRKRRREGDDGGSADDPANTTTRVRRARSPEDEITSVQGSTRLEAKKQRRREGREAGRRRAPIVSEAEFLARRESVERVMVVRQREELTQIGVLEDKVLVEHYVARESQTSLIGNVYLGRVQNVLPSMEAAFIDIGKGRNAVLYAGEVNWQALGHKDGNPRKIESVLSSGQTVLVQVTKDPVGAKGARLTSQVSLAGRFLVYVPDGTTSGISRKLPDTERNRLKTLLKEVVPASAGVIVRTAAEGASEEELTQDVERLKARWEEIEAKTKGRGNNPQLLHGEPDLTLKVVRDLFTEDFAQLVVQGDDVWDLVHGYVSDMAPDLLERVEKYDVADHNGVDLFSTYRIDEQIAKALDRKVFLPSGGSLIIDRTEAMTVVDVNTGKFTGSGGNLEETVTKNNLEAAEEVVRQLRLRDIGGIIVVDFIDMVLEANRDLVLRRMVECLGRDRTRHQVAEVTSLGLVQMTRKRIGTGLLEAFSTDCEHCHGRGVVVHDLPVEPKRGGDDHGGRGRGGGNNSGGNSGNNGNSNAGNGTGNGGGNAGGDGGESGGGRRRRGGRGRGEAQEQAPAPAPAHKPSPAEFAAMAKAEVHKDDVADDVPADEQAPEPAADETVETLAPEGESVVEVETATAPAEPKVVTRRRRGVSRTVTTSAEEPAAATEPEPVEPESVAPEPVAPEPVAPEPATEPEPTQPTQQTAPAEPKVITRQRRGVSRTVSTPAPAAVEVVVPAPVAAEAEPAEPAVAPEPPKVVTRTRGGASRRTPVTPVADDGVEAAEPAGEPEAETPHVPIKRKGKR